MIDHLVIVALTNNYSKDLLCFSIQSFVTRVAAFWHINLLLFKGKADLFLTFSLDI